MIATILQLVAILLLIAGVPWFVSRWPQLCEAVRYELEMRRVKRARDRRAKAKRVAVTTQWRR